jgi:hypothetical protein
MFLTEFKLVTRLVSMGSVEQAAWRDKASRGVGFARAKRARTHANIVVDDHLIFGKVRKQRVAYFVLGSRSPAILNTGSVK